MEIKTVAGGEINFAVRLIYNVFMQFEAPDYSMEGIKTFRDTVLNNDAFLKSLKFYGYYLDSKLVGVIATRNRGNHIALFFVDGKHHRQGIGRKLFDTVLKNSTADSITVNSSPYAVRIYSRLGFVQADVEKTVTGIRFTPMIYKK